MSASTRLIDRVASVVESSTSRRGFIGRSALVGSAVAVTGSGYVLRPGTAYAAVCRCPRQAGTGGQICGCGELCCDGYTEFCCQIYGENSCPPETVLAGWWKVDNSSFCDGAARYYMDCNQLRPACGCGSGGVCRPPNNNCGCRACNYRADGCTTFRYGNCNNDITCVGPIMCRVVTCTRPWEIDPGCSTVARTDPATRWHDRPCLDAPIEIGDDARSWAMAIFADYLEREPSTQELFLYGSRMQQGEDRVTVSLDLARSDTYIGFFVNDLYRSVFGREADAGGRDFWVGVIQSGRAPADVAAELYASPEFFQQSGSVDGFITRLYEEILERSPEAQGLAFWRGQIDAGVSRYTIAGQFYDSIESRRKRVRSLYQYFLRRGTDQGGLEFWAEQLTGDDDLRLAAFLSGSDEYLRRAINRFPASDPAMTALATTGDDR